MQSGAGNDCMLLKTAVVPYERHGDKQPTRYLTQTLDGAISMGQFSCAPIRSIIL